MPKITGNPVATPVPKPDWNQTDPSKADYIKNKPTIPYITNSVQGADITLNDRGNYPLRNLKIFGHSEQLGTPSPTTPVEVVSPPFARVFDENGTALVTVDSHLAVEGITGVCGIPVKQGGNYTIKVNGKDQQFLCDEVDFEKGVYIQRIYGREITSETRQWKESVTKTDKNGKTYYQHLITDWQTYYFGSKYGAICSHFPVYAGGLINQEGYFWINTTANYGFNTNIPTREEFFAFLDAEKAKGTPVTVWGALPTAQIKEIPLTEDELNAYKTLAENTSLTHFMNSDGGILKITYGADTKKYIDNKFAELSAAIISTGGNV